MECSRSYDIQAGMGLSYSAVMKYMDNIVKIYCTSVATIISAFITAFGFHNFVITLPFIVGVVIVTYSVRLYSTGGAKK